MAEDYNYYFTAEEEAVLKTLVEDARRQNEEAFTHIEGDYSIVDVEDYSMVTQDQRRMIDTLAGLEVKLNGG